MASFRPSIWKPVRCLLVIIWRHWRKSEGGLGPVRASDGGVPALRADTPFFRIRRPGCRRPPFPRVALRDPASGSIRDGTRRLYASRRLCRIRGCEVRPQPGRERPSSGLQRSRRVCRRRGIGAIRSAIPIRPRRSSTTFRGHREYGEGRSIVAGLRLGVAAGESGESESVEIHDCCFSPVLPRVFWGTRS